MESLIVGALIGFGTLILYFAYFIIKDIEGGKGKLSRFVFYIVIAAILFFLWANNPDKFESTLTWGLFALAFWYFIKCVLEHWQTISEARQREELNRYQSIMDQLEIIKSKLDKQNGNKDKEWL